MNESPDRETGTEEIVLERSARHQGRLQVIATKLGEKFNAPALFNEETQKELDLWVAENKEKVLTFLQQIYTELKKMKSAQAPGHELAHLLDNLTSAVRIFEAYDDFSEAEKLEVTLSCLGHDMGRFVEKDLDKINPKDTAFLMPALIGRHAMRKFGIPEPLQLRILYNIASGPVPETEHRTADVAHQCDREYLAGSRTVARDLAFDVVLADRELMIPAKEELRARLPMPESPEDRWFLVQMEFFMRNIYPPVSPNGHVVVNNIKQENAVIEMLATEGKKEEFEQVFAPELGLTASENLHWSKKPIPAEVFVAAQKEEKEFLDNLDLSTYVPGNEVDLIKTLTASEKISLPTDFDRIFEGKLGHCTDQEKKNLWMVVQYALFRCHDRRLSDLQKLEKSKEISGVSAVVATWLIEELQSREEIYRRTVK